MHIKRVVPRLIAPLALILISYIATTHSWAAGRDTFGNQAIIINTGSTNAAGYRIYVSSDGQATYIDNRGERRGQIDEQLALKFFRDIETAQPLNDLPHRQECIKAASFGSSTYIKFGRQTSPDLSCPGDDQSQQLANDAREIRNALNIDNGSRFRSHGLTPNLS